MIEQKHLYVSQTTEHTIIQIHSVLTLLCNTAHKHIEPLLPLYIGCNVSCSYFSIEFSQSDLILVNLSKYGIRSNISSLKEVFSLVVINE